MLGAFDDSGSFDFGAPNPSGSVLHAEAIEFFPAPKHTLELENEGQHLDNYEGNNKDVSFSPSSFVLRADVAVFSPTSKLMPSYLRSAYTWAFGSGGLW